MNKETINYLIKLVKQDLEREKKFIENVSNFSFMNNYWQRRMNGAKKRISLANTTIQILKAGNVNEA